jgi:hypothetical protein
MPDAPIPADGWTPVGRTSNTRYFRGAPDVLFVIPDDGVKDDGASAEINADFQIRFARELGHPVAVVVHMTSLLSQDADARRVYASRMDISDFYAAALVAGNPISRAIASFFLGLTKPKFPTRVHDSFESALAWIDSVRAGTTT